MTHKVAGMAAQLYAICGGRFPPSPLRGGCPTFAVSESTSEGQGKHRFGATIGFDDRVDLFFVHVSFEPGEAPWPSLAFEVNLEGMVTGIADEPDRGVEVDPGNDWQIFVDPQKAFNPDLEAMMRPQYDITGYSETEVAGVIDHLVPELIGDLERCGTLVGVGTR